MAKQIIIPNADDPTPPLDLAQVIADVVRSGARIEISPRNSAYGVVYLVVKVIPRPPAYPIMKVLHSVYEMNELAGFLRRARIFAFVLPDLASGDQPPPSPEPPTE